MGTLPVYASLRRHAAVLQHAAQGPLLASQDDITYLE
jgi:hypothetical protein